MNERDSLPHRLRHPAWLVFLLGGALGSGINLGLTAALHDVAGMDAQLSFFLGTLANELFHHVYYHEVYVNQEIRLRTPPAIQFSLYLIVAALAAGLLWVLQAGLGLQFIWATLAALVILAAANSIINRISTFSSAALAMVEYRDMGESFYDDQTDSGKVNWFRAAFHRARFSRLRRFVEEAYRPGMAIADLGCGNCWWNEAGLPVMGVDINEPMMRWAQRHGRLSEFRVTEDLARTGLAGESFDIVVVSEVLEHLLNVEEVLREVRRILKPGGVLLVTVPYDFFLGPFFILFNMNCLWQGYVRGSGIHRYRCGHVNHFTRGRLAAALVAGGFVAKRMFVVNGLTLYVEATSG